MCVCVRVCFHYTYMTMHTQLKNHRILCPIVCFVALLVACLHYIELEASHMVPEHRIGNCSRTMQCFLTSFLHCKEKIKYFQKLLKTQAEATPNDGCWTMVATK